jgi:hypothetical protein
VAILTWVLISLAIWHFTVFVPDHFVGGINGAFLAAAVGGVLGGYLLSGLEFPTRHDTTVATVALGIPGTLIALALLYFVGKRREEAQQA